MMTLEYLLKEGTKVLEQNEIQEARLDAWLLLEYVTGVSRAYSLHIRPMKWKRKRQKRTRS